MPNNDGTHQNSALHPQIQDWIGEYLEKHPHAKQGPGHLVLDDLDVSNSQLDFTVNYIWGLIAVFEYGKLVEDYMKAHNLTAEQCKREFHELSRLIFKIFTVREERRGEIRPASTKKEVTEFTKLVDEFIWAYPRATLGPAREVIERLDVSDVALDRVAKICQRLARGDYTGDSANFKEFAVEYVMRNGLGDEILSQHLTETMELMLKIKAIPEEERK